MDSNDKPTLTPFETLGCEVLESFGFQVDTYEGLWDDMENQKYFYSYRDKDNPNMALQLFTNDIDDWERVGQVRIYFDKDCYNYITLADFPKFLKMWKREEIPF